MTITARPETPPRLTIEDSEPKSRAVVGWAILGILFVALQIYIFVSWILSGPEATPHGSTPLPQWMEYLIRGQEVVYPILAVVCIYYFLVRPWRRNGRLGLDGMLLIACMSMFWQDPITNYVQPWFQYNTHFFNRGSWMEQIPGNIAPNGAQVAEPLIAVAPLYIVMLLPAIVSANWVMGKVKQRWPNITRVRLVLACFAYLVVFDLVCELAWMRTGFYAYPGTVDWLTLWHGHYYQFPIYESAMFGGILTVWACVRYFRNDRGETWAERGVDRVRTTPRRLTAIRTLALVGMFNLIYIVFNIGYVWIAAHQTGWPDDIVNRSYLNGLCGPGTQYACPDPGVPIPLPNSVHVGPAGELVPVQAGK